MRRHPNQLRLDFETKQRILHVISTQHLESYQVQERFGLNRTTADYLIKEAKKPVVA